MDDLGKLTLWQIFFIIIVPTIISGIPALTAALVQKKSQRMENAEIKESEANAADKVASAYDKIVSDLQERIDKMEARFSKLENDTSARERAWITRQTTLEEEIKNLDARLKRQRKRINYLEDGVQILIKQLKSLGVEPDFILEDENGKGE